jgi:hypothetical protein
MPITEIVETDHSESEPLMERLADVRTPEEARAILGQRRINTYALIGHCLTVAFAGITLYLLVGMATGSQGLWVIGWMLPLAFLALFFGSFSYGDIYWRVKGHRPAKPPMFIRVLDRLNRNI